MVWKNTVQPDRPQITIQCGACALRAGYLMVYARAHTNTHAQYVILLFQGDSGYANAPQCYVYTYVAYLVWE